eukprot:CAMPEP_0119306522 /NCGR_PEP_ID=MMETSP1333-20130426/7258_1 /TAXON_ID=418940 /ORGANISM="Scyphosphaera apsteinii, Strain RCC1455" /LENGTH=379 /DNA_ID=CAMNT_0007309839 /DNA_START=22 /DNA_END=1161 /DNA_ORIENTATION=-
MLLMLLGLSAIEPQPPASALITRRSTLTGKVLLGAGLVPALFSPEQAASSLVSPPASLVLPPIGVGAWAWGDSLFWGYDSKNDAQLQELFEYVSSTPNAFFDTAEVYGFGRSETLIGDFERRSGRRVSVASKFAALPWRTSRQDVVKACEASLRRMKRGSMELYQIHFPNAWANAAYWDGLADCYDKGLVQNVGVSNYGADAVNAVSEVLSARGIPLFSNQIQYSLLYPYANQNGLKQRCDELGVKILAYSPLGLGLLSGKYSKDRLPTGPRAQLATAFFTDNEAGANQLVEEVKKVADNHGGTPSQVAINWCIAKGTTPIPGSRSLRQAKDNLGALSWKLDASEVASLDAAAARIKPLVAASPFPAKDVFTGLKMFDS